MLFLTIVGQPDGKDHIALCNKTDKIHVLRLYSISLYKKAAECLVDKNEQTSTNRDLTPKVKENYEYAEKELNAK